MNILIKPLDDADIEAMADEMREMDRMEFDVMSQGQAPIDCLKHLKRKSRRARAAYVDGDLVCCYGVLAPTLISVEGNPWLCATDAVNDPKIRRQFLKFGASEMQWLVRDFRKLWNLVSAENKIAIRWLKWLGFEFDRDPLMFGRSEFLKFQMEN